MKAHSQSTGSVANSVKGQRETYINWQRHLSPALTSSLAHAVERRVDCGFLCDELGCACICVHAVALRGAFIISDVEYWSEMDDDLVGVGFFSCRLLFFLLVCFFFFLGGESAAYFLALPHLVTSEVSVLIFFRFCGSYKHHQQVLNHSANQKQNARNLHRQEDPARDRCLPDLC